MSLLAHSYRMLRCLRCHRIGNATDCIAGCDCFERRYEEVYMVPAPDVIGALEITLMDIKSMAADATDEARTYVRETAEPRIRETLAFLGER